MDRRFVALVLTLSSTLTVVACKHDDDRPPAAEDGDRGNGGGGGAASSDGGTIVAEGGLDADTDASTACNTVDVTGATIDQLAATDAAPPGSGGTIEDGTYDLTDARIYGSTGAGATGISYRGALVIDTTAATIERVIVTVGQQQSQTLEDRSSLRYTANGTSIAAQVVCPTGRANEQLSYTATGTTLVLTNVSTRESFSFSKRP